MQEITLKSQVIVITLQFILSFWLIRWELWGVVDYIVGGKHATKIRRGQSFIEWLFYSRFKDDIPKAYQILYSTILFGHPIILIVCLFVSGIIGTIIIYVMIIFNLSWMLITYIMYAHTGAEIPYDRWLRRKRGKRVRYDKPEKK